MDVYTTKITRIYKDGNGKIIIETADGGCFYQSFAETNHLRPIEQTDALYRSFQVGDEIEYKKSGRSTWIILRNKTQDERDVKSFIENPTQYAIVSNFWYSPDNKFTHIECVSPVWKEFAFDVRCHIPLRLLDEITVTRTPGQEKGTYKYQFGRNVTLWQDIQNDLQNKVLKGWSAEKRQILLDKLSQVVLKK